MKKQHGLVNKIEPKFAIPTHYGLIIGTKEDADKFEESVQKNIKVVELIK